ncbi:hypothetical protein BT96DRAFT_945371 [Gymnopus androsaceus JB14]|uniref:Uncharacterized protein n=1 Tax=Gymnopus androsaceus JB14 TaxID=1447944 RepID=A0A6A4H140_9AGAR|nr:hypothetical protein BT96DRAFT_945371 [Gymnopus androsaceus JB14]
MGDRVQFWQQEARETRREAVEDEDKGMAPLYDDDSNEGSMRKHEIALSVADRANIGIVTQQPRGDEEPLVLTKVLHSKKYVEYVRAQSTKTVGREDSDKKDSDSQSDAPRESRKTKPNQGSELVELNPKAAKPLYGQAFHARNYFSEFSEKEDSDSEPDAPRKSCKTKVGRSIAVRWERVQEGESDSDTSVAAPLWSPQEGRRLWHLVETRSTIPTQPCGAREEEEDCGTSLRRGSRFRLSPCRAREEEEDFSTSSRCGAQFQLSPCRAHKEEEDCGTSLSAEHNSDCRAERNSDSACRAVKKKKTVAPPPAEPTKKKKTVGPRRDMEVDSDSVPTRLPKKIAGKGRDKVGFVRKACVEMQETDENEEQPRKQAWLNREHGKKHGKEKNIADQSKVVGGQGRKWKRDEDAARVIAQLSRPIVKLPKCKSGD